jgi:hypothetical protein
MTTIRADAEGIYLITNGSRYRPGAVRGYGHNPNNDMSDGGLQAGEHVKVHKIGGSPLCRITLADGRRLVWHTEYRME